MQRHAAESRLQARLQAYRQRLIRQELQELLLALFPCWTAVQCRHVLAQVLFETGDIVSTVPPVRAPRYSTWQRCRTAGS